MSSEGVYPSLFMSALSSQSDRTLSLCWEQHCKLLPGVQGIHASQVAAWNVEDVSKPSHWPTYCSFSFFGSAFVHLRRDVFVLQVFRFVQNLIGCEEQARVFKEEVRPPSVCEWCWRYIPRPVTSQLLILLHIRRWLTGRPSCCWHRPTLWRSWASSLDPPSKSPTPSSCSRAQTRDSSDPTLTHRGRCAADHHVPKSFCRRDKKTLTPFSCVWCPVPIREREGGEGGGG